MHAFSFCQLSRDASEGLGSVCRLLCCKQDAPMWIRIETVKERIRGPAESLMLFSNENSFKWYNHTIISSCNVVFFFPVACQWTTALCSKFCSIWNHVMGFTTNHRTSFTDKMRMPNRIRLIVQPYSDVPSHQNQTEPKNTVKLKTWYLLNCVL